MINTVKVANTVAVQVVSVSVPVGFPPEAFNQPGYYIDMFFWWLPLETRVYHSDRHAIIVINGIRTVVQMNRGMISGNNKNSRRKPLFFFCRLKKLLQTIVSVTIS